MCLVISATATKTFKRRYYKTNGLICGYKILEKCSRGTYSPYQWKQYRLGWNHPQYVAESLFNKKYDFRGIDSGALHLYRNLKDAKNYALNVYQIVVKVYFYYKDILGVGKADIAVRKLFVRSFKPQ